MSSNPFSRFEAGNAASNAEGWINSKKRGRDDKVIARDRQRALDSRKKSRPLGRKSKGKVRGKTNGRKNIGKVDDEMEDFLVDDDRDIDDFCEESEYSDVDRHQKMRQQKDPNFNESDISSDSEDIDTPNSAPKKKNQRSVIDVMSNFFESKRALGGELCTENTFLPKSKKKISNAPKRRSRARNLSNGRSSKIKQAPKRSGTVVTLSSSEESFNVNNDEDDSSDESIEVKTLDRRKSKRKPSKLKSSHTSKQNSTMTAFSEDESSSEEDSGSEFEYVKSSGNRRKKEMDQNIKRKPNKKQKGLSNGNTSRIDKEKKKIPLTSNDDSSDDSEIEITFSTINEERQKRNRISAKETKSEKKSSTSLKPLKGKTEKKSEDKDEYEDDSENDGIFSPLKKKQVKEGLVNKSGNRSMLVKSFKDRDKTPAVKRRIKKRTSSIIADEEDISEEERMAIALAMSESQASFQAQQPEKECPPKRKKRKISPTKRLVHEGDANEEDMAMALAMSESQAAFEASQTESPDIELDNTSVEGEEGDDDDDESVMVLETLDERYKEAEKVLQTANRLSEQVLLNMRAWSSRHSSGDAAQGMIVDGALAMRNYRNDKDCNNNDHLWISHENIKELCSPTLKLADYQLIGVNWLALLHEMKVKIGDGERANVNGILADVMGLGKTVQTIAFLAWLCSKNNTGQRTKMGNSNYKHKISVGEDGYSAKPHIIIVPASVLDNWMHEFQKFAPQVKVVKYHGPLELRKQLRSNLTWRLSKTRRDYNPEQSVDVIVTTFSYFSGTKADDRAFLRRFKFEYMVIDEAHCLKNPRSNAYQNLDKLKTSHRLLLTGTPVQNSPKELMSLICFLMPLFRTKSSSSWESEDETKNDGGARMLEYFVSLEGGDIKSDRAAYKKLKQLFAPFVLRRRKEDVLSQALPKKTRQVVRVPLNTNMRRMYDSLLNSHLNAKNSNQTMIKSAADRQHIFTVLRKVANHPLLLRNRHLNNLETEHLAEHLRLYGYFGDSCKPNLVKKELKKMSDFDIHLAALDVISENPDREKEMSRYVLLESDLYCSPKLEKLRILIPDLVSKGHRILIFSQWTNCLDLLGCLMESLGMTFFRLDGQTPISVRQQMINEFNSDETIPVFLLSTKAGGMGINLTAANICILHDLDFNPFNDLQAEDRCHRIGQKKPVKVIKMVTNDTVDEAIYEMQQRKTEMNAAILEKGGSIDAMKDKKKKNQEIKSMLQCQFDRYLSKQS
mmetsp:Transcript_30421/g.34677  ORF Transcript_30421/g.34677 Transcript_30421/m.34677 type:complete len:1240 (-) Transcript_30421:270-3989(-)